MTPGVVYQDLTHKPCRHAKKMSAIFPWRLVLASQSQESFVDQCCWVESVITTLAIKVARSEPPKLIVYQRYQLSFSSTIPFPETQQQPSNLALVRLQCRYPRGARHHLNILDP